MPKLKETTITIRVTKPLKATLMAEAKRERRKLSQLCEILLTDALTAKKGQAAA